ncbi:MAG: hypothetical protein IJK67_00780 [Bacilli bacterium]|nr:hypothetical protein [Bacilli bacterium]
MKKIKSYLIIFVLLFMLTGCYKSETTLTVNSDRSIDLDAKIIVDDNFNETPYLNNMSQYTNRGIKIQRLTESGYNGYKITKKYNNIDDISTEDIIKVDISKYFESDFNEKYLFKVEKSFFKNIYTANFTIDNNVIMRFVNNEMDKQTEDDFLDIVKEILNNGLNEFNKSKTEKVYSSEKNELKIDDDVKYEITISKDSAVTKITASNKLYSYSKEQKSIQLKDLDVSDVVKLTKDDKKDKTDTSGIKFIVKLPHKSINNNAEVVSGSGETLTWTFDQSKSNDIIFSFELSNGISYLMVIGFGALVIAIIVVFIYLIVKLKDKKRSNIESKPVFMSSNEEENDLKETDENIMQSDNASDEEKVPDVINIE